MTDGFQDISAEPTMDERDDVDKEEEEDDDDDDNEEQSSESEKDTNLEDEEDASDWDSDYKSPWETLRKDVQTSLSPGYDKQVDTFLNEGTSEVVAEAKAFNALVPVYRRELQRLYLLIEQAV